MALSILVNGTTEYIGWVLNGSISIDRTNGDTKGRARFTLHDHYPPLLATVLITDGATTYFDGEVIAYTLREVRDGQWFADVDAEDAGTVPSAVIAPFMLSDGNTEHMWLEVLGADAPYALWRLGESSGTTAADYYLGTDGTYVGSPTLGVTGPGAFTDTAVTFNGTSQYVTCGTAPIVSGQTDLTIAAWFKTTYKTNLTAIYSERVTGDINAAVCRLVMDTTGRPRFQMRGSSGTLTDITPGSGDWADGVWHQVIATLTGSTVKIYVDGIGVATGTKLHVNTTAVNYVSIGKDYHSATSYFNGSLDEVAVWQSALTDSASTSAVRRLYLAAHAHRYKTFERTYMFDALKSPNAQSIATVTTYEPGLEAGMITAVGNENWGGPYEYWIDSVTTTWPTSDLPLFTLRLSTYTTATAGAMRLDTLLKRLA